MLKPVLTEFTEKHTEIVLNLGDVFSYRRLRIVESALVSCLDDDPRFKKDKLQVLTVVVDSVVCCAASFAVFTNDMKQSSLNLYARIDLVITEKTYRGYGIGRVILLGLMVYLLRMYGKCLYSMSCLAAHQAIAKVLKSVSFEGEIRENKGFEHETLNLESMDGVKYLENLEILLEEALKQTVGRLSRRQ